MTNSTSAIETEMAACPICGEQDFSPVLTAESMDHLASMPFTVVSCNSCGLMMTNPRPTADAIGEFYESGFYEQGESLIKRSLINPVMKGFHELRLRQVTQRMTGGKILDVGCGKGKFLQVAARHGWEAWGIEPSHRSLSFVQDKSGMKIIGGRFEDADLPDGYFDVVTMWHTLEHFYHPDDTLKKVRRKLRDGGLLVVRVPNGASWDFSMGRAKWFHLDVPRHLYHFSPDSLRKLIGQAGFRVVSISTSSLEDNPIGTLQTVMAAVGFRSGSVFSLIKGGSGTGTTASKLVKNLGTAAGIAVLALPSFIIAELAQKAGRGGTLTVAAVKNKYSPE
ncbi:MAG: class I SAM-dependent methyltransferase [Thermoleophilia bacterium]